MLKRQKGAVAVEFAIVTPILLAIAFGCLQFGWLLTNYVAVANAASAGARFFANQRGNTTPYSATQTQVNASSNSLTAANLAITTSVNGTSCTSDATCASSLTHSMDSTTVAQASVTVSYTFTPLLTGNVAWLNTAMPASLNSTVVERVQ